MKNELRTKKSLKPDLIGMRLEAFGVHLELIG
jgi:hypothetical protein